MFLWQYLTTLLLIAVYICKAQKCDNFTDLDLAHSIVGTSVKVRLLLYTKPHQTCGTLVSHTNLSAHGQFNLSKPTSFIVHGYRPTGSPPVWLGNITQLVLNRTDGNVIVVDWNQGAANLDYFKAVKNTHVTAKHLTDFITMMKKHGANLSSIHLIGVSLGAHISGFVGKSLNGKIGRITALDPAGPLFTGRGPDERLDAADAQFVDVLHTDMDALGFRAPLGHIDFYANEGTDQPGCPKTIFSGSKYFKCDHQRSVFLYLDSLDRVCDIAAYPCPSYKDFMDGKCSDCSRFGDAGCPVFGYDIINWKEELLKGGPTKAFFNTNKDSPFCLTGYNVDVVIWNQEVRWGYITVKLHGENTEAVATIDHKASKFKRYETTHLFAQFDKDLQSVDKVSLTFSTGNVFKPKYKLRILRVRLTHLNRKQPLCRYDIILQEDKEVTFRPIPCGNFNF